MTTTAAAQAKPLGPQDDFSAQIAATVDKLPGEEIRCVRVFENCYRCNWWVRDRSVLWGGATSGRIVKSRFLRATLTSDGMLLEDVAENVAE